ncbi:MAG: hypothetical protein H7062_14210 [Candidatus Saccharimonas sp.]|nr:hypothetical protein [Planctomycetaceae bacterium]
MRTVMRWKAICLLGVLSLWTVASVQAQQPTVVLSLKSVDELLDDADFIGEALGQEGARETAEEFIGQFTGDKGLAGIDLEKPLGLYWNVSAAGQPEMPVIFLPIGDEDAFKGLVKMLAPDLKENDGLWSMTAVGQRLFAKMANGYCFVSNSADMLARTADPKKIVNGKYDIALDVSIASIPQPLKEAFLQQTEQQGRASLENGPPPKNDAEKKGQELGFEWTLAALTAVVNDGDRMTLGFDVNSESRLASVDFGLSGKSGTALAKAMTAYGKTTPAFAAVATEDAPFRLVMSYPTTGMLEKIDELFTAMRDVADAEIDKDEKLKDDADKKAAKDVAKRLFDIGQATMKSGSLHSVIVLDEGDDDTVLIVGGTRVAKGDDAGKLFDDILKLAKESPESGKVKADVAKHAGARIHSITPDLKEEQAAMFGESAGHMAVRADSLWFSMGGGNLDALKKALDLSGKTAAKPGSPISLRVKPATLVTLLASDDEGLIERAEALAGKPGDVLNVEIVPTPSGAKLHIEFGVDLFKLGIEE